MSHHVYTPITFVMNLARYNSLTAEQRAAVDRAALKASAASRQYGADNDAKLLGEIEALAKGKVAFNEIDSAAFQAASGPIAKEIAKVAGEDFTASVMAVISQ
jgi:TRAP-type C4-dicarboxylate transport system substrate-binding protein